MSDLDDPQAASNLLIFEIGNSHISVATSVDSSVRTSQRFAHDDAEKMLAYADEAWEALPAEQIRALAGASVVPKVLNDLRERLTDRYDAPLLIVGSEIRPPLTMAVEAPEKVGTDRVCAAAAAYEVVGRACVIASFGTAITIDCVNDEGVFMGGAILPGLNLSARILHEGTAALPPVSIEPPTEVYGSSTEQAIRIGVIVGAVGALREITERYATELKSWPQLVVTGGNAQLIAEHCEFIDSVVPDLCLRGIALAFRKHFAMFEEL